MCVCVCVCVCVVCVFVHFSGSHHFSSSLLLLVLLLLPPPLAACIWQCAAKDRRSCPAHPAAAAAVSTFVFSVFPFSFRISSLKFFQHKQIRRELLGTSSTSSSSSSSSTPLLQSRITSAPPASAAAPVASRGYQPAPVQRCDD